MRTSDTEDLALKFRADCGFSSTEALSLYNVVSQIGIITVFLPMSKSAYGMSISEGEHKFILVNSNTVLGRQHFTIAHELYHLFYDDKPTPHLCSTSGKSKTEKVADAFASALLLPKRGILKLLPMEMVKHKSISIPQVIKLEQYFGVSRQCILYRLKNTDLITKQQLDYFLSIPVKDSAEKYGFDTALYEPGNHNRVIGDYVETAIELFENNVISEGHRDELLSVLRDE